MDSIHLSAPEILHRLQNPTLYLPDSLKTGSGEWGGRDRRGGRGDVGVAKGIQKTPTPPNALLTSRVELLLSGQDEHASALWPAPSSPLPRAVSPPHLPARLTGNCRDLWLWLMSDRNATGRLREHPSGLRNLPNRLLSKRGC